jgi:hypothetical protein
VELAYGIRIEFIIMKVGFMYSKEKTKTKTKINKNKNKNKN